MVLMYHWWPLWQLTCSMLELPCLAGHSPVCGAAAAGVGSGVWLPVPICERLPLLCAAPGMQKLQCSVEQGRCSAGAAGSIGHGNRAFATAGYCQPKESGTAAVGNLQQHQLSTCSSAQGTNTAAGNPSRHGQQQHHSSKYTMIDWATRLFGVR